MNYVIATYGGVIEHRKYDEEAPKALQYNLTALSNILLEKEVSGSENLIKQVTVVCPPIKTEEYKDYYRKDFWIEQFKELHGIDIVFMDYEGENKHASYDQYIYAYLKYPNFDYYVIVEDDYCIDPTCKDFDLELVDIYKRKFPDGKGYLCSFAGTTHGHPYHAAISNGIISRESFAELGENILNTFYSTVARWPQIQFSLMFINAGMEIKDMQDIFCAPFFQAFDRSKINFDVFAKTRVMFTPMQYMYGIVKPRE